VEQHPGEATNPIVHDASWAEPITVAEDTSIAKAPPGVDTTAAGAAPLAGIPPALDR
jgi:hypothetical protein